MTDLDLLDRLEAFYDEVPRGRSTVEEYGGLVLFVPNGAALPFYGRPGRHGGPVTGRGVAALRHRQRELGLPEALEWVHEMTPELVTVAAEGGMTVLQAPLMVLDSPALPDQTPSGVRLLKADAEDLADDISAGDAVAAIGFRTAGTATGPAGPAERDLAATPVSAKRLRYESARLAGGLAARALAESPEFGVAACGQYQRAGDVVEIVGVATLPVARRRGLASAVTAALARHALAQGAALVFLSAADPAVERIYARLGFRRVGTACIAEPAR